MIVSAFNVPDARDVSLESISLAELQHLFDEMTIPSEDAAENVYPLNVFPRIKLKPVFRLLFDVVHKVFLSQTETCD